MFRIFIASIVGVALALGALPAHAQVGADLNISPRRVVFGPGERSATVYVFNQGDETATYTVELTDRVMLADGQIAAAADHPEVAVSSALDLVQHTPRRVTLGPRESQAIRVRARPGGDGVSEHRTHLTVTALPPEDAGFTAEQAAEDDGDAVALQVVALFSISIPVIVRDGPADARAAIEQPVLRGAEDVGGNGGIALDLVRLGENSVYGDLEIRAGQGPDERVVGLIRGIAVYPEIERRAVLAPLAEAVAPGETLTVLYRDDDAQPGAVLATVSLVAP